MSDEIERNMGPQPIGSIMESLSLKAHDLVAASDVQITHKMIARACKGRRLTMKVKLKLRDALNNAAEGVEEDYTLGDLFNYK